MAQIQPADSVTPPLHTDQNGYPPTQSKQSENGVAQDNSLRSRPNPRRLSPKLGDLGQFFKYFDKAMDEYDKDMLDALKSNMDNLLIFAALFSAVNSAFLALSVPMLSADSGDETNRLLRLLVQGVDNSTLTPKDIGPPPFSAPSDGVRINQLFSVSLTCSMLAAFGALLGQQWITSYKRRPAGGFEEERRERQRRLLGAKRWRLEPVLELVLPMLLQLSLIIFFVGMVAYLQSRSPPVALPNTILSWFGAAFFISTILFALVDPHCPFKTPFSEAVNTVLSRSLQWLRDQQWVILHAPRRYSYRWATVSLKTRSYMQEWFLRRWPDEILEGYSLRRILATSADSKTLHDVALNIPLIKNNHSLNVIYSNNIAVSHLYQLYETQSVQPNGGDTVYSAAICHIVLAAGQESPERTNHLLQDHELSIIQSAAQAHVSKPDDPISSLPSSIMTVALAYLVSEPGVGAALANDDSIEQEYLDFLRQSVRSTATPDVPIAATAWVLLSSSTFTPCDDRRRKFREDLDFSESPPTRFQSGTGVFCYASEAYNKFYQPSRDNVQRISDEVLLCVAQALASQHPLSKTARPLILTILDGMNDILNLKMEVQRVSRLGIIVDALPPLLADDEVGLAATRLLHTILDCTKPQAGIRPITISQATVVALAAQVPDDDEVKDWLGAYQGPSQTIP